MRRSLAVRSSDPCTGCPWATRTPVSGVDGPLRAGPAFGRNSYPTAPPRFSAAWTPPARSVSVASIPPTAAAIPSGSRYWRVERGIHGTRASHRRFVQRLRGGGRGTPGLRQPRRRRRRLGAPAGQHVRRRRPQTHRRTDQPPRNPAPQRYARHVRFDHAHGGGLRGGYRRRRTRPCRRHDNRPRSAGLRRRVGAPPSRGVESESHRTTSRNSWTRTSSAHWPPPWTSSGTRGRRSSSSPCPIPPRWT